MTTAAPTTLATTLAPTTLAPTTFYNNEVSIESQISEDLFLGDVATISLDTYVNLDLFDLFITYKKPNGLSGRWAASQSPIDDSIAYYQTSKSDLDVAGTWKLQVLAISPSIRHHSRIIDLIVKDTLSPITTLAPTTLAPTTAAP